MNCLPTTTLTNDSLVALRQLRKSAGFTLVMIVRMAALGIPSVQRARWLARQP